MQHADAPTQPLAYEEEPPRVSLGRMARLALLVLGIVAIPVVFWLSTVEHVDRQWRGLTLGMMRTRVSQKLCAFASYPNRQYQGLAPGQYVIRYELFRMSKATMIQIVFNADGTVADAQPIFDV